MLPVGQDPVTHVPPAHREPAPQACPQVPQFDPSLEVSTQAPPQEVSPGRQAQVPETQAWAALQDVPQAPQSIGLVWRSGHPLVHDVPLQVQAPPVQTPPAGQLVPHAPQLWGSVEGSTQVVPHRMEPVLQVHWPEMQVALAPQAVPQAPQWLESVARSAQVEPHCTVPAGQAQTPETHDAPEGQAVPQLPQWLALVARSTQVPPQSVRGAVHVAPPPPPPPPPQPASGPSSKERTRKAPEAALEALRFVLMLDSPLRNLPKLTRIARPGTSLPPPRTTRAGRARFVNTHGTPHGADRPRNPGAHVLD